MKLRPRIPACFLCIAVTGLVAGCGPSSSLDLVPVSGTVTYKGKPLTIGDGQVIFIPQGQTKGPQGIGRIEEDGTYEMTTANKPGAVVGTHKVVVSCRRKVSEQEAKNLVIGNLLIPGQYANPVRTPLEITVEPGGQTYDIKLE